MLLLSIGWTGRVALISNKVSRGDCSTRLRRQSALQTSCGRNKRVKPVCQPLSLHSGLIPTVHLLKEHYVAIETMEFTPYNVSCWIFGWWWVGWEVVLQMCDYAVQFSFIWNMIWNPLKNSVQYTYFCKATLEITFEKSLRFLCNMIWILTK